MISTLIYAVLVFSFFDLSFGRPHYSLSTSIKGKDFLRAFYFENIPDPTHGRVNYVDAGTAARENLTYSSADHFVLRGDFKKTLNPNGPGRDSVRIKSYNQYSTSVILVNLRHMPQGCGTWPAIWTLGDSWPDSGEIDILEGVNDRGPNQATLHTSPGCQMPSWRDEIGSPVLNNCDTSVNNNKGCGVTFNDWRSYGPSFNQNGGGWFAMERTDSYIKFWFWPRAGNVPSDVRNGGSSINPDSWGTPVAYFPGDQCPISEKFASHNIMINLTFCGDWAGNDYDGSGCPSTCVDYVNNNPNDFKDAYFDFAWLNVYE